MIDTTCNTTFFSYKIFNPITNFIKQAMISNTKYLNSPPYKPINGFEPIEVLYEMP